MTRESSEGPSTHRARAAGIRATSQAALSTSTFGVGPAMAGAVIILFALVRFVQYSTDVPGAAWSLTAWVVLTVTIAVGIPVVRSRAFQPSGALSAAFAAALALVVTIDIRAVWGYTGVGIFPTATVAVSGVLVAAAALRPAREIIAATIAIALALIALMVGGNRATPVVLGGEITIFVIIVIPPIITALTMHAYRRLARNVLDRVLIQSTVHAPAFGTGLLASERLRSIDREIETLFDRVSSEHLPLPLPPEEAARAEALAIELRSHLVSGRRSTWLHDAVHESDILNGHVQLDDVGTSAALMDTQQRDGFLAALWFLVQSSEGGRHTAEVHFTEPSGSDAAIFRVDIRVHGLSQRSVEPSAWVALHSVGAVVDTRTTDGVAFSLECVVRSAREARDR